MIFLRSNTAVIVAVGPFYDKSDGVTIETALTITNERITLIAETDAGSAPTLILDNVTGATSATSNDLNYITNGDNGMMQIELAAADVNRVGRMKLSITDAANHVPVFHEFFVLPQAIYDWLTGVIVPLPANLTQILGTAAATPATAGILDVNVKNIDNDAASASGTVTFPNATLASTTNITAGTIATVTNLTNAPTNGDLTATMKTSVTTAVPTAAVNAAAVWDLDATAHQTTGTFGQAIGDPVADTNTIYKAVVTDAAGATVGVDVVAVKADTAAILVDTGTTLDAALAVVDGNVDSILVDTAEIGAAGAGLTNINLPNQTMDIVGNITGNLSGSVGSLTGHTVQTGDSYAIVSSGTHGNAALKTLIDAVDNFIDTEIGDLTAAILVIDDLLDTEVGAIKGVTDALTVAGATKLLAHLGGVLTVVVGVGSTTTAIVLNAATGINGGAPSAVNDYYNGAVLVITSGALAGQRTSITDYDGASVTLTVVALTAGPAAAVTGVII